MFSSPHTGADRTRRRRVIAITAVGVVGLLLPASLTAAAPTASEDHALPVSGQPAAVTRPEVVAGPQPGPAAVDLELLATYETGEFDASAAEIVQYDTARDRLLVVNAQAGVIDVLDLTGVDDGEIARTAQLSAVGVPADDGSTIPEGAVVNSVTVLPGHVVAAVESVDKTDAGWVVIWSSGDDGDEVVQALRVGSLPDMVTHADPTGQDCASTCTLVVANEGEPADDFSTDPEGSVSVITLGDVAVPPTQDDVRTVRFTAYDEGTPLPEGVRVFGPDVPVPAGQEPAGRVARNLEPEFISVSADGRTAFVALQEANAIATLDLDAAELTDLWAIPDKDWGAEGNVLDPSDRDDAIALGSWPVTGLAMPDGIDTYTHEGSTLVATANEGDAREWGDYVEPVRLGSDDYPLCPDAFGGEEAVAELEDPAALGRLNVTTADGLREGADCYEEIHSFGGRGLSILTADGELVFDSAGMVEEHLAGLIETGELPESAWNATNDATPSFDNRSDDKGPEPEYVEVVSVGARVYALLGLERIGGVMTFDVTDPQDVQVVGYDNNRNWDVEFDGEPEDLSEVGDLGAEGLTSFQRPGAPDDRGYVAVGNEISGTTSVFRATDRSFDQVGGADRWETAAVVSQVVESTGFPAELSRAVVTTGEDWPDALSAAPGAAWLSSPLLLAKSGAVPSASEQELERLEPAELTVFGGSEAIGDDVLAELADLSGDVERIGGEDRYETAVLRALDRAEAPDHVYLATGADWSDALSAGSAAASGDDVVLLTRPDRLPAVVEDYLGEVDPETVTVLGGSSAVSRPVIEQVERYAGTVELLEGEDRYETATLLSGRLDPGVRTVYVVTGEDYPDALTATVLTRTYDDPVLLTRPDTLTDVTADEIERLTPDRIVVVGGRDAVEPGVRDALLELLP